MRIRDMKLSMTLEQEDYGLFVTTDNEALFRDLHEAIDKVIEKHYAPIEKGVSKE